jgi:hypothetical protein
MISTDEFSVARFVVLTAALLKIQVLWGSYRRRHESVSKHQFFGRPIPNVVAVSTEISWLQQSTCYWFIYLLWSSFFVVIVDICATRDQTCQQAPGSAWTWQLLPTGDTRTLLLAWTLHPKRSFLINSSSYYLQQASVCALYASLLFVIFRFSSYCVRVMFSSLWLASPKTSQDLCPLYCQLNRLAISPSSVS